MYNSYNAGNITLAQSQIPLLHPDSYKYAMYSIYKCLYTIVLYNTICEYYKYKYVTYIMYFLFYYSTS